MPTTTRTCNIEIAYNTKNGTWTFTNRDNNEIILEGDLTAYRGSNTFNWIPANGQFTFESFTIASLTLQAPANGDPIERGITVGRSSFTLDLNKLGCSLSDYDDEVTDQEYEYAFVINLDGRSIPCDPKIFNKSN